MRWPIVAAALFLGTLPLRAVPTDAGTAEAPPNVQQEAQSYAVTFVQLCQQLAPQYVRPVEPVDLIEAGVIGLYESAREPVPAGLRAGLKKAAAAGNGDELFKLVAQARARLGDAAAVKEDRALLVSMHALRRVLDPYCGLANVAWSNRGDEWLQGVGFELATGVEGDVVPLAAMPGDSGPSTSPLHQFVGPWRVQTVIPGSPAQVAGLQIGDQITHLDGKAVTEPKTLDALRAWLQTAGDPDLKSSPCKFTIHRAGRKVPVELTLRSATYQPESVFGTQRRPDNQWNFWGDRKDKLGYVRIGGISLTTPQQLARAVRTLKADGMRGLVLDLRWCPGGYLNPSARMAQFFIKEGEIARVDSRRTGRQPIQQQVFRSGAGIASLAAEDPPVGFGEFGDFPLVVLVNGETMGGGELIAAALQDNKCGLIVGQRTFGKGSVQTQVTLANYLAMPARLQGLQFKLTSGTFVRPNGKNLHRSPDGKATEDWGVRPADAKYELPVSPELSRQLKDWWQVQTLRPGRSNESLPLDDPEKDPQRQGALQILRGLINK